MRSTQMEVPDTAFQGQNSTISGRLHMVLQLGVMNWKLPLGACMCGPSRCAGEWSGCITHTRGSDA